VTGTQAIYQEREVSSLSRMVITHTDSEHYIVNVASLHNYVPISSALPSHLRKSSFHINSETTLRNNAALQIRLAKQKPLPSATDQLDHHVSSTAPEVPLTNVEDRIAQNLRNRDDQPTSDHELHKAPPLMPLFSHHPKDNPRKGKAKQSTQAMYVC
jgi:hypothetical protein